MRSISANIARLDTLLDIVFLGNQHQTDRTELLYTPAFQRERSIANCWSCDCLIDIRARPRPSTFFLAFLTIRHTSRHRIKVRRWGEMTAFISSTRLSLKEKNRWRIHRAVAPWSMFAPARRPSPAPTLFQRSSRLDTLLDVASLSSRHENDRIDLLCAPTLERERSIANCQSCDGLIDVRARSIKPPFFSVPHD